jgi:hypothetical protein
VFPPGMRPVDPDAEAARLAEQRVQPKMPGISDDDVILVNTPSGLKRLRVTSIAEVGSQVVIRCERAGD